MRSENGIPRPWQPNNLGQDVRDLSRRVDELEARRTFVSLERIVEGGTINANVGKQFTEVVQKDIVIDGGNLGEGALDGQRMVGAIIETNEAANRGVKIDDTGLRGYDADGNRYMIADETGLTLAGTLVSEGDTSDTGLAPANGKAYRTRATVGRRRTGSTTAIDLTPGVWFEAEQYAGSGSPVPFKALPAGISASDDLATGVRMLSGKNDSRDAGASISASSTGADIAVESTIANGYRSGTHFQMGRSEWVLSRYGDTHNLEQRFKAGSKISYPPSAVAADSWMELMSIYGIRLTAPTVEINGGRVMKTVAPNIPTDQQPIELIANGSATTNAFGEFTITFPTGTFPNACTSIFIVPNSGGGTIPVVNGTGALTKNACNAVQPGNGNKAITYSYRAIGY